jgi:hypothetical protein
MAEMDLSYCSFISYRRSHSLANVLPTLSGLLRDTDAVDEK